MGHLVIAPATIAASSIGSPLELSAVQISSVLTGPDDQSEPGIPATNVAQTLFLRFVMFGQAPSNPGKRPTIFLTAGAGEKVEVTSTYPNMVNVMDGVNPTEAASATRYDPDDQNVYLVKVFVFIPGNDYELRIQNNDSEAREFTLVAASSLTESRQPWLNASAPFPTSSSAVVSYKLVVNESQSQSLFLDNKGTGGLKVTAFADPFGPEFSVPPGRLPLTIPPNPQVPVSLAVINTAPRAPTTPDGISSLSSALTSDEPNAGAVAGHNNSVTFVTDLRLPRFDSPDPFLINDAFVNTGYSYMVLTLNGWNFDVGPAAVTFSSVQAKVIGSPTNQTIQVEVPELPDGPYEVTVTTRAGTTVSSEPFIITEIKPAFVDFRPQFIPLEGPQGTRVTLRGTNFTIQGRFAPVVQFGSFEAAIVGMPTDSEIVAIVPTMPTSAVKITITSGPVSCISFQSFTVTDH
jgi:hypothetical protein